MSRKIAFGGILTAICVILNYMAAAMPSGKLGLYALSSVAIAAAVVELDIKWGVLVYAASTVLIFMLTGNINALLLFTSFFGCYPLLKFYIEKQRTPAIEMLLKFLSFNLLGVLGYFIYSAIFGVSPINLTLFSQWMLVGLAVAAQVVFLLYDYVLSRLIDYYVNRIKRAI